MCWQLTGPYQAVAAFIWYGPSMGINILLNKSACLYCSRIACLVWDLEIGFIFPSFALMQKWEIWMPGICQDDPGGSQMTPRWMSRVESQALGREVQIRGGIKKHPYSILDGWLNFKSWLQYVSQKTFHVMKLGGSAWVQKAEEKNTQEETVWFDRCLA